MQLFLNNEAKIKDELPSVYQAIITAISCAIDDCQDLVTEFEKGNAKRATIIKFFDKEKTQICSIEINKQTVISAIANKLRHVLNQNISENGSTLYFTITPQIKDILANLPPGTPPTSNKTWRRTTTNQKPRQPNFDGKGITNETSSTSSSVSNTNATNTTSAQNGNPKPPIARPRRQRNRTNIITPPPTPTQPLAITGVANSVKHQPNSASTISTTRATTPATSSSASSAVNLTPKDRSPEKKSSTSSTTEHQDKKSHGDNGKKRSSYKKHSDKKKKRKKPAQAVEEKKHIDPLKETTALLPKQPSKKSLDKKMRRKHQHKHKHRQQIIKTLPSNLPKKSTVELHFEPIPEAAYAPPKKQEPSIEDRIREIEGKIDSIKSSSCWCCFFGKSDEAKKLQTEKQNLELAQQRKIN